MRKPTRALWVTAAVVVLLLVPIPIRGRAIESILDLGHLVVGALLAFAAWSLLRPRMEGNDLGVAVASFVLATAVGLAAEGVQNWTGRQMSWTDGFANAAGAAAYLLIAGGRRSKRRVLVVGGVVALLVGCVPAGRVLWDTIQQHRDAPMLASFERPFEMTRWAFVEAAGTRVAHHATDGEQSLAVVLGPGRYPAASLIWPLPDWSGHEALAFDVAVGGTAPIALIVKVEDHEHDRETFVYEDRFHRTFELPPGNHALEIPIEAIRNGPKDRALDITDVRSVTWFVDGLDGTRTIHLDNVRLR